MDQNHALMRDPATVGSRIYVGNLSELVTNTEFQGHFSKYGTILGVMICRGFGFIQFDNEQNAQSAIQQEHNTTFHNRKLIVRAAVRNQTFPPNKPQQQQQPQPQPPQQQQQQPQQPQQPQQQQQQQQTQPIQTPAIEQKGTLEKTIPNNSGENVVTNAVPQAVGQDLNRVARPAWTVRNQQQKQQQQPQQQQQPSQQQQQQQQRIGGPMGQFNNNISAIVDNNIRDRSPLGNDKNSNDNKWMGINGSSTDSNVLDKNPNNYPNRMQPYSHHQYAIPPTPARYFDRNDCEIIVVAKALTNYAEVIEDRLKCHGLLVDLLFPNDDVPIGKVLANIASRGSYFAVLITRENEEYRTIAINILFGPPSDHRIMPIDDGIDFIVNTFKEKFRGESSRNNSRILPKAVEITPTTSYAAPPLLARHPDAIQTLINLLAENRPITVLQYDRVIKYLQERRALQLKAEVGDAPHITIPPPIDPEAELQKKILDILNKPSITNLTTPSSYGGQSAADFSNAAQLPAGDFLSSANQPQILNDPKVQKALDSLLQGTFFNF